jgi:DNA-binding PadR family transcriptional regulator
MFKGHFHGFERHAHLFERGHLKYVILDLLKDKPAHGYEIIKALEERFHGFYSPSAGSVYPTLQLLEDMGYVKSSDQDGKKVYTITAEGNAFLKEREETVDKIRDRMQNWWGQGRREEFQDTFHKFRDLGRLIGRNSDQMDPDKWNKIKVIINNAYRDIEEVVKK